MIAQQEAHTRTARRVRGGIEQLYHAAEHFTDSQLEALDYAVADVWSAFGFRMRPCQCCRASTPEVLLSICQGRSYCPECARAAGYPTFRSRRMRIRYRRVS